MTQPAPAIERRFVPTPSGVIHVAMAGAGNPVLLLHQTPRSWDEYRDVLPLLGRRFHAIAMDTIGFGDSAPVQGDASIEACAEAALQLLAALGHAHAAVVGHHTGAVVAMEMAARAPGRVTALVLSSCPMVDAARRAAHRSKRPIDAVDPAPDGRHVAELWSRRQPFYPPGDVALLERFIVDALKAGRMAVEGHRMVNRYRMEERCLRIACPTLVIAAPADPHAHPSASHVAAAIHGARLTEIPGGMVPLPDQLPQAFAQAVLDFLQEVEARAGPPSLAAQRTIR